MISDDRKSHFAHVITDGIWNDDLVEYKDEEMAVRVARQAIDNFFGKIEALDGVVRQKLMSLKRGVTENSPEWDTLYSKYFEEELQRRGNF